MRISQHIPDFATGHEPVRDYRRDDEQLELGRSLTGSWSGNSGDTKVLVILCTDGVLESDGWRFPESRHYQSPSQLTGPVSVLVAAFKLGRRRGSGMGRSARWAI